ncbi:MAG: 3-hydroxy-9,10-secoandrosta-1,3,5(10)-triene-9,17-dione monooxygenase reductase subunit [Kibdelosporangium sp.]
MTPATPTLPVATEFRKVLGHFCTGVTVITGAGPAGFACQAFAALSLDPPLVLFCPGRGSRTWQAIAGSGRFCVNVLAEDQQELSARFGRAGADKFTGTAWSPSPGGAPILDGVLTWIDCSVEEVRDGGDHHVVIGRVQHLGTCRDAQPLLFYRGRYTATDQKAERKPNAMLDNLFTWPRHDDWI